MTRGVAVSFGIFCFSVWDLFRISDFVLRIYDDSREKKRTKTETVASLHGSDLEKTERDYADSGI